MSYKIFIRKPAEKYIAKLDRPTRIRIINAIDNLSEDPAKGELLTNHQATYKLRVGTYRILYDVIATKVTVDIIKVGPREIGRAHV